MSEKMADYIDHTLLKPEATENDIKKLCKEAEDNRFFSVCINSSYVKLAARELQGTSVKVCVVVGFPLGVTTTAVKTYEAAEAVENGADEVDMVIHVGQLKSGNEQYVYDDIAGVVRAAKGKVVKVIIETALLNDEEKKKACLISRKAGAAFVKTSTGFGPGGATVADIELMRETVGPEMGIKASGGVRSAETALDMVRAGANRIGTSSGIAIIRG